MTTSWYVSEQQVRTIKTALTFIRAFESSPVHWWKSRPSGNRRSPGNGGMADILIQFNQLVDTMKLSITYRRSMSSMISFALASPWVRMRYSLTHITMWSLKVPLMTWWSKSGDKSSWICARGKYCVNGWYAIRDRSNLSMHVTYFDISTDTKFFPENTWIKTFDQESCLLMWPPTWSQYIQVFGLGFASIMSHKYLLHTM